jgi:hypothetical protein
MKTDEGVPNHEPARALGHVAQFEGPEGAVFETPALLPSPGTSGSKQKSLDILRYFEQLQSICGGVIQASLAGPNSAKVAESQQFASELSTWCLVLGERRESELLRVAAQEYEFALLALTQGHYRQAFKGLRLVLELALQAIYLSANELRLREWIDNRIGTIWNNIFEGDDAVFSARFSEAFFSELSPHIKTYGQLAKNLYRECSECVHGNTPKYVPLPSSLTFDQSVFDLWHSKAEIMAVVTHFALALRYLNELPEADISRLEPFLADRIGYLSEIRLLLGGPTQS